MFTDIVHLPENRRKTGTQYAIRILVGSVVAWLALQSVGHHDPLWAIISVVMVSEPELQSAVLAFRWRVTNTLLGCGVGVLFLWLAGPKIWAILLAMVVCVLISTWIMDAPTGWRIGPISSAIVMTPGVLHNDQHIGMDEALLRTSAVLAGSAIAVIVAWVLDVVLPKLKPSRRVSS
ncbi:MAG TPA: FUSC family protein [Candidatus Koribacter sp.]|jgi:uncharacterized membrane protein YccC